MKIDFIEMNVKCKAESMLIFTNAATHIANQLGLDDEEGLIEIKFFKDRFGATAGSKKENLHGQTIKRGPRHVVIEIVTDNYNITEQAITISHELVHAKQFLVDGLVVDKKLPYREQQHEIEAFALQNKLFLNFYNHWVNK